MKGLSLGALIDALMRALTQGRHEVALEHLVELIALEPDEPRWHERHGDVLSMLGQKHEAATAYRAAALRYDVQGLSDHGSELRRVADQLDAAHP